MNHLRDRLAAANPVPNARRYSREQITATVSMILSDAAPADESLTEHSTGDEVRTPTAAASRPSAPALRRPRRRWVYAVPAAAGLAAVLVFVGLPGRQDSAFAGWTAVPAGVPAPDSSKVGTRCKATMKDFGVHPLKSSVDDLKVVLAERRGDWTYALLADRNNVADCLQHDGSVEKGHSLASGHEVAPQPTATGVTSILIAGSPSDAGGSFYTSYGRAGAKVAKVVVNDPSIGPVTATVKGGYWAAWWPAAKERDDRPVGFDKFSLTFKLKDGTQHTIRPWPINKY